MQLSAPLLLIGTIGVLEWPWAG